MLTQKSEYNPLFFKKLPLKEINPQPKKFIPVLEDIPEEKLLKIPIN